MLNRRSVCPGVIEIMDIYDMTSVYQWHRPHLWATGTERMRGWGFVWGAEGMIRKYFHMTWGEGKKKLKTKKKRGSRHCFFSLPHNTGALSSCFSLTLSKLFLAWERKCLLCGLVRWSHAVFPPSKSTVPYPKWFAYFPCNTRLKKDEGEIKRVRGES